MVSTRRRDHDIVARLEFGRIAVFVECDRILVGDAFLERIAEVPEIAVDLVLFDFEVGDRRQQLRVPVDEALVLVDQALLVERDEDFQDSGRQALVHGETLARPVAGGAEALQLVEDQAAGFLFPFPDPVNESLAAHLAAARKLALHQLALDDHLGGDARMVHARLPQHVLAAHPLEADHDVLQRVVERVAHVQRTGHVRWRNDDREGFRARLGVGAGAESVGLVPGLGDPRFYFCGIVGLFEHFLTRFCSLRAIAV